MNYIITEQSASFVHEGQIQLVNATHPKFRAIVAALVEGDIHTAQSMVSLEAHIADVSHGRVTVKDGSRVVFQAGKPEEEELGGPVVEKLLAVLREGLPFEPLMRFIDNLMDNPSRRSREQLYKFLAHKNLPISDDGHFLAYKAVRSDWMDIYSGQFENKVGAVLEMPRRNVDDNPNNTCSYGFHVGTLEYVKNFGGGSTGSKYLICKINPADVVSVPTDYTCQKVRTCKYVVLEEYTGPLPETYYGVEDDEDVAEDWYTDWEYDVNADDTDEDEEVDDVDADAAAADAADRLPYYPLLTRSFPW